MAILKKYNEYVGLEKIDVLLEDTNPTSLFFQIFDISETFPGGKSAFRINGSDYLKVGSEIRVEVLNSEGKVIYSEYPKYLEGSSRLVSVYVYPDELYGAATITIVGEARIIPGTAYTPRRNTSGVPAEWQGVFNIRWQKQILIDPILRNDSKIRFYNPPVIDAQELYTPYLARTYTTSSNPEWAEYSASQISGKLVGSEYTLVMSDGGTFRREMIGGILNVDSKSYSTKIKEVLNDTLAIASVPYQDTSSVTDVYLNIQGRVTAQENVLTIPSPAVYQNFGASDYLIRYETEPTYSETQDFRSFARIHINDMDTFSGDVYSAKLFMRFVGSDRGYDPLGDLVLESSEMMIDSQSVNLEQRYGYLYTQDTIDLYWTSSRHGNDDSVILLHTNNKILDSMFISGSTTARGDSSYDIIYPNSQSIDFDKNTEYLFEASFYGKQTLKTLSENEGTSREAVLHVFASGSAFNDTPNLAKQFGRRGKLITTLELKNLGSGITQKRFGEVEQGFFSDRTGKGQIQYVIESGDWYISNTGVSATQESGFSPGSALFLIPIGDWHRREKIQFKAEFYNQKGDRADLFATSSEEFFVGSNTFLQGDDNVLSGSLFIGNAIGEGIEMAGVQSAYIRNIGYRGYYSASDGSAPGGFMIWSGSVLTDINSLAGVPRYGGVGLELHGTEIPSGSDIRHALRFRTDTGRLEITGSIYVTDGYFSGSIEANQIKVPLGGVTGDETASAWYDPDTGKYFRAAITQDGYGFFMSASIGGWLVNSSSIFSSRGLARIYAGEYTLGSGVPASGQTSLTAASGTYINEYNYWYDNGLFQAGDSTGYVKWDGSELLINGTVAVGIGVNIMYAPYTDFDLTSTPNFVNTTGFTSASLDSSTSVFAGKSFKVAFSVTADEDWIFFGDSNTDYNINFTAGKRWLISFYAFGTGGIDQFVRPRIKMSNGTSYPATYTDYIELGGSWSRYSFIVDLVGNSNTNGMLEMYIKNDGTSEDFYFDGLMIESVPAGLTPNPSPFSLPGVTKIDGNQIQTGKMLSQNWNNSTAGSLIDLNGGTMHLGGSGSAAKLYFDGANLTISSSIYADSGYFAGTVNIGSSTNIVYAPYTDFDLTSAPNFTDSGSFISASLDSSTSVFAEKCIKLDFLVEDDYDWIFFGDSNTDYNINFTAGKRWLISFYALASWGASAIEVRPQLKMADGNTYGAFTDKQGIATSWTRYSFIVDLIGNSNTNGMLIMHVNGHIVPPLYVLIDGLMIEAVPAGLTPNPSPFSLPGVTKIDGNQIQTGKMLSQNWNNSTAGSLIDLNGGTMHLGGSGSAAKLYFDGADLHIDGTINVGVGVNIMYAPYTDFDLTSRPNFVNIDSFTSASLDSSTSVFAGKSLKVAFTSATDEDWLYFGDSNTDYNINFTAGKRWLVSFYAKGSVGTDQRVRPRIKMSNGTSYPAVYTDVEELTVSWTRYSFIVDLTANSNTNGILEMYIDNNTISVPDFYFDGLMIEAVPDGLTPNPSPFSLPGVTKIDGNQIQTGKILSPDEQTYWDLDNNIIHNEDNIGNYSELTVGSLKFHRAGFESTPFKYASQVQYIPAEDLIFGNEFNFEDNGYIPYPDGNYEVLYNPVLVPVFFSGSIDVTQYMKWGVDTKESQSFTPIGRLQGGGTFVSSSIAGTVDFARVTATPTNTNDHTTYNAAISTGVDAYSISNDACDTTKGWNSVTVRIKMVITKDPSGDKFSDTDISYAVRFGFGSNATATSFGATGYYYETYTSNFIGLYNSTTLYQSYTLNHNSQIQYPLVALQRYAYSENGAFPVSIVISLDQITYIGEPDTLIEFTGSGIASATIIGY